MEAVLDLVMVPILGQKRGNSRPERGLGSRLEEKWVGHGLRTKMKGAFLDLAIVLGLGGRTQGSLTRS